jgi:D-tyrosyl-tRNA(Tyr) deacylase
MRIFIQRVSEASVTVGNQLQSSIKKGMLVLLGISTEDDLLDVEWLANKMVHLRIFDDEHGVMNRSVKEIGGEILLVSQFTLLASTVKGNRPSYVKAARPEQAIPLYDAMILQLSKLLDNPIQTGIFGADMQVRLLNDGPVSIFIDSRNRD